MIVRIYPTKWARLLQTATIRLKKYIGRKGSWSRDPDARKLCETDPTVKQLDKLFLAARQNYDPRDNH
jgi:hypothetical protein